MKLGLINRVYRHFGDPIKFKFSIGTKRSVSVALKDAEMISPHGKYIAATVAIPNVPPVYLEQGKELYLGSGYADHIKIDLPGFPEEFLTISHDAEKKTVTLENQAQSQEAVFESPTIARITPEKKNKFFAPEKFLSPFPGWILRRLKSISGSTIL